MQALRRHLGLIAAITLLAAGATAVFAALRPASFRSHADLLVATGFLSGAYGPQVKPPFQTQAQVLVTQAKLASEPAVADLASQLLHGRFSPAEIRQAVTVSASPNLDIMTVTAVAGSPTDARQIANAYSVSVARRARTQARHEILTAAATVATALAANPSPARTQQLLAQQRRLELLAAGTDGGVQVTQPAVTASDANLPALRAGHPGGDHRAGAGYPGGLCRRPLRVPDRTRPSWPSGSTAERSAGSWADDDANATAVVALVAR